MADEATKQRAQISIAATLPMGTTIEVAIEKIKRELVRAGVEEVTAFNIEYSDLPA